MLAKNVTRYYDVFPRIVPTQQETMVTIHPRTSRHQFQTAETYRIALIPIEGFEGEVHWSEYPWITISAQDGNLHVPCRFAGEQEYLLVIETESGKPIAEIHLYALDGDLFFRRPYKGDTHMHTYYSDGKESPAYLAASCRKIGMDFIAITDHYKYAPSLEAIQTFQDMPVDLRIFPGEEVHPPKNHVHIVNFGGSVSVNKLFNRDSYWAEVEKISKRLTFLPARLDRYPFASSIWCFDKIRQAGGLGIFCHPYWISRQHYDVPITLTDLLFEHQPYDALELIGGYHLHEAESNTLQVARYQEERARGRRIPIVGASDSHGCETGKLFGWYYSIVFSPSLDLSDIITSIKEYYSVAVEALPNEKVRAFGPYRLARYAQFLIREILPAHDKGCLEEGRLMLAHVTGNLQAAQSLQSLQGGTASLYDHLWAK